MQIVSNGDNLHEMPNPVFWEKYEKIFQYVVCWKFYPEWLALRGPDTLGKFSYKGDNCCDLKTSLHWKERIHFHTFFLK